MLLKGDNMRTRMDTHGWVNFARNCPKCNTFIPKYIRLCPKCGSYVRRTHNGMIVVAK